MGPSSLPAAESALVILVPTAEGLVKPFRARHDPSAALGVPAHVTLLYPFLPPHQIGTTTHGTLRTFFAGQHAFDFSVTTLKRFESPIAVLYLALEPAEPFGQLTLALGGLYPDLPPYRGKFAQIVPHLTVAQAPDAGTLDAIIDQFARASHDRLPIAATAREVALLDNQSGRWETRAVFALGHAANLPPGPTLATPADVPAIERLIAAAYTKYIARIGKKPSPMLDDYGARVAAGTAWVVRAADDLAGLVVLEPEAGHLLLVNIAVSPVHQGRGIGRRLMAFAEHEARRRGLPEVRLYTHALMYENFRLYVWLGYEETGRAHEAGYDRVFMRKRLT
jgi:ribosomal protein S18 acetylase RimI-like enzyme